uniref:Uncharacterized protein n=1 Tax=Meloidogyne enterolobii TaxID=390850 RepID=A0A6V7UNA6_MELEN|nr:unnamed protein product [Meloidogyne enterolobii]
MEVKSEGNEESEKDKDKEYLQKNDKDKFNQQLNEDKYRMLYKYQKIDKDLN